MGGQSPNHAPEKEEVPAVGCAGVVDSPILLLVCFHKALRAELDNLHRRATLLSSSPSTDRPSRSSVLDLRQRYEFLHKIYKYHCAAEDEVVFRALDTQVRNVAPTYSLEHNSISDLFDSLFYWLDVLSSDDGPSSKQCRELALCTKTIQTSISQHMLKEEEQVFPLLMQHLSFKEQALLVWQFICSVPITLLEDILPWMMSYLSVDEQADVMYCIKETVPKESFLREVVISWLGKKSLSFCRAYTSGADEKVSLCSGKSLDLRELPIMYSSGEFLSHGKSQQGESESVHLQEAASNCPIDGLRFCHGIIMKELKEILAELHDMRRYRNILSLSSASSRIMFITDVLIFYSDALEKVIFPVLNKCVNDGLSFSHRRFPGESQIEGLLCVLQSFNALNRKPLFELVEKLCWQVESFVTEINHHLDYQESEVIPLICKNCDDEMQQSLLCKSILMMPLGLLKSVTSWLSANLTDDGSKMVLCSIKLAGPVIGTAFASLLHNWLCIGYSGKTSLEIFRKELQEIFKNRSSFIPEQNNEGTGFLDMNMRPSKRPHPSEAKASSTDKAKDMQSSTSASADTCLITRDSLSVKPQNTDGCSTSYSSGINLQIFFSEALKKISSFSQLLADQPDLETNVLEPKPIDQIFHFHKALEKDLEYLVTVSASMVEELDGLKDFRQRFLIVQVLYHAHSTAEDEIAFPALEAKGTLQNISRSYTIDHRLEEEHFQNVANLLDEISELHSFLSSAMTSTVGVVALDERMLTYQDMCMKLHGMCKSMQTTLGHHVHREEIELWPLFLEHFSEEEQEKIIGSIIGRTRAEVLQTMIPWLMASLSPSEQNTMMSSWRKATKNTMFDEWLGEWWEGKKRNDISLVMEEKTIPPSGTANSLEVVAAYLSKEASSVLKRENLCDPRLVLLQGNSNDVTTKPTGDANEHAQTKILNRDREKQQHSKTEKLHVGIVNHKSVEVDDTTVKPMQISAAQNFTPLQEHLLTMSQADLEASIRRVSRDPTLDPQQKSYLIQNLLMSRWIISQQVSHSHETTFNDGAEIPGCTVSYRDPVKLTFGCKHYKRNCKLLFSCCNRLFTCKYCHDSASDHPMDRKLTTKMMCMKCLQIQPVGPKCSNISCNGFSMARYFCNICKLFDDEREIYHCPFCNLCRLGKGLGIDYFHCMNCNACLSKSLAVHICREKCFESNCPICHDDIFTSRSPVKALPCGHLMHSTCFQDYTCTHYTCPICSKSLGDMQVYFGMLDALLAEEKLPPEYADQSQGIFCNDCEKRGTAPFHWLYHKCPQCCSYNTRLL